MGVETIVGARRDEAVSIRGLRLGGLRIDGFRGLRLDGLRRRGGRDLALVERAGIAHGRDRIGLDTRAPVARRGAW